MSGRRRYSDEDITSVIKDLFIKGKVRVLAIQTLRHIAQALRPSNEQNLRNILRDLQEGFRAIESILVWQDGPIFYVVYGDQRFKASELNGSIRYIPCMVIEGKPGPSIPDMCFANLLASVMGQDPLPRSGISKIIETRTIISWILLRRRRGTLNSVTPSDVREEFLRVYGGESSSLYRRHWSQELDSTRMRKLVFIARSCMLFKLEEQLDQCERICPKQDAQVSLKVLYKIMKLEMHDRARSKPQHKGRRILLRFINAVESSNDRSKVRLELSSEEELLFQQITSSESSTTERSGSKRGSTSITNKATSQGISKCEAGVSKLLMGYNSLKGGNFSEDEMRTLKEKINDLQSYVSQLKARRLN